MRNNRYYIGVKKDSSVTEYGWIYVRSAKGLLDLKDGEIPLYDGLSNSMTEAHKRSDVAKITEGEYNAIFSKNVDGEDYSDLLKQTITVALERKERVTNQ
ncbi:hypothetical protein [Aneurinibacillus tyrosinisolvens]|uniref:hypothetical protein n=1 Tax=Aneurinibacillus tyrosinisolvens TaxID=1443435 RepID=UPI00063F4BC9|nr:hypothetical protein [Aneurinibacillus tyrosinisolvens]